MGAYETEFTIIKNPKKKRLLSQRQVSEGPEELTIYIEIFLRG